MGKLNFGFNFVYVLSAGTAASCSLKLQISRIKFNVNFFCHQPPSPDEARLAAWRSALVPYAAEWGLELPAVPAAVVGDVTNASGNEGLLRSKGLRVDILEDARGVEGYARFRAEQPQLDLEDWKGRSAL